MKQEQHLYEYATIRVVPAVEREEFVNAGLILFCKKQKYIKVLFKVNEEKIATLCREFDLEELNKNLDAFEKIAKGDKSGGIIATYDIAERFRWLTAVRSSSLQTSRPHPGICKDLDETAEKL